MKRFVWIVIILMLMLVVAVFLPKVLAVRPDFFQAAKVTNPVTGEAKNTVVIPAAAVEVAPSLFYLGEAEDKGRVVEGYAIVDYKKGYGKPGTDCGNGVCESGENANKCPLDCAGGGSEPETSSCYGFLAKGAKWKTLEPYLVNPTNIRGLGLDWVMSNLAGDINKWEMAAGVDILGDGSSTDEVLLADLLSPDDQNEVYFADIDSAGAIGITVVWGIFRGPPQSRELVEWDQVYDEVDFDWSASGEAGKMDFESIATHELGHSVGLGDLYEASCSEETMYGYADLGEIKKRTLEAGDVTGVRELYR